MWLDLIIYTPMYITAFWAIVLLTSSINKNRAKHFLGLFMVTAFLLYLSHTFYFKHEYSTYLYFDPIYIFVSLMVYPMYYWYIKLLTNEVKMNYKNLRSLAPAVLFMIAISFVYIVMSPDEKDSYLYNFLINKNSSIGSSSLVNTQIFLFYLSRIVFSAQVVYFLLKGRKLVIQYNERISNFYSNLEDKKIVWVNYLLYSFVITSIMSIVFNVIGRSVFVEKSILLFFPSIIFSVLLFFIGYQGYIQNHTVTDLKKDESEPSILNIKEINKEQLKKKLSALFDSDKIYKNPELKITQVCEMLQTNRTYVSNVLNNDFHCSFSDFVNQYRVDEAKKILCDKKNKSYSLNYVSEMAGFGSVNSFIRIFKNVEGITPGKYHEINISRDQ